MSRLFVGNFHFEEDLAQAVEASHRLSPAGASRAHLRDLTSDLAAAWLAVVEPGDAIFAPAGPPDFDRQGLDALGVPQPNWITELPPSTEVLDPAITSLIPWGQTAQTQQLTQQLGLEVPAPAPAIVALVNSREFRWQVECELGIAPSGSASLSTVEAVRQHLAVWGSCSAGWVLKANYGMAGRQRWLGRGAVLDSKGSAWLTQRLPWGPVVFEPWLEQIAEAGLQFEIPREGAPEFLGLALLLTAPNGTYRGSHVTYQPSHLESWLPAIEKGHRIAQRVQQAGYWGPLGIDAMQYRAANGQPQLRMLQDLNARWTMGRLALGWKRYLPSGTDYVWRHGPDERTPAQLPQQLQRIPTARRSWLELASDSLRSHRLASNLCHPSSSILCLGDPARKSR